ncbi:MAG: hypothetical protein ACXW4E_02090 [Anaerolineales bacterium]
MKKPLVVYYTILIAIFLLSACQGGAPASTVTPAATNTSAPTATAMPTVTPSPSPTPNPFFSGEGSFKSGDGSQTVSLTFVNHSSKDLTILWVNFDGVEEQTYPLPRLQELNIDSSATHAFRIRNETGDVIKEILATDESNQVYFISDDMNVAYQPTPGPMPTLIAAPLGERSYADRPDDFPGMYQVHVLYVLPADAEDQQRDLDGKFNRSVEAANEWFFEQSSGSKIRFDTYQEQLDITFIQIDETSDQVYDGSVAEYGGALWIRDILEAKLEAVNVFQPGKLYIAMFDISRHPSTCADAAHPPDLMGRLAGFYTAAEIEAGWSCPRDEPFGAASTFSDMGIPHEIVHLLGFASSCGNNPTSRENISHTGDFNEDLMWAADANSTEAWDVSHMVLDPGNDDYFRHKIPNCPDLASSAFLDPLPENPETPPGWPVEWKLP